MKQGSIARDPRHRHDIHHKKKKKKQKKLLREQARFEGCIKIRMFHLTLKNNF